MRYTINEGAVIIGKFTTGDTVTISLYDLSDSSSVSLTSGACAEISTTGVFKWDTTDITTQPTSMTEYLWIMDNSTIKKYGKIILGGYPDDVEKLLKVQKNKWDIKNNVLTIYDDDETTTLYSFDLKDSKGVASSRNVFQRVPK